MLKSSKPSWQYVNHVSKMVLLLGEKTKTGFHTAEENVM
jgi:hypothetical protein